MVRDNGMARSEDTTVVTLAHTCSVFQCGRNMHVVDSYPPLPFSTVNTAMGAVFCPGDGWSQWRPTHIPGTHHQSIQHNIVIVSLNS